MNNIIMIMIIVCFAAFICLTVSRPLKALFHVVAGSALGAIGISVFNSLLAPVGVTVGFNVITALISGVLGIPGFFMLYIMAAMMR
ncbi:MAG: pro-sigmaK processing inhibitor BofA family protein [Clostridiales bacterium]|jgi:inhibitor of the pro-sigma K processing machinery|nr:pro-sigmaK processing inhibitor BofA family protein [Clostridiales bacterium]